MKTTGQKWPPRWLDGRGPDPLANQARALLRATGTPLSRGRREDTWASIHDRLDGRRRSAVRGWALRAAFVVVAITAVWVLAGRFAPLREEASGEATVVRVQGRARISVRARWRATHEGERLTLPARLRVDAGASTRVALPAGVRLVVDGPAAVGVAAREITLDDGAALHAVEPGHGAFVVRLGAYSVIVRGTKFWTAREGREAAICLIEGKVEVRGSGGRLAELEPGQGWRSSEDAPEYPGELPCREEAGDAGGTVAEGGTGAGTGTGTGAGTGTAAGTGTGTAAGTGTATAAGTGTAALTGTATAAGGGAGTGSAIAAATAGDGVARPEAEPVVGRGLVPRRSAEAPEAETQTEAETERQPERAADCAADPTPTRCFRRLADGAGLVAETALLRLAQLRRSSGDRRGALDALLEYRRRFPAGALAQEADLGILELRLASGSSLARDAADRFLRVHATSEHTAEVRAIRGELLHRAGSCAAALPDYDAALAGRVSAVRRDEATFGRAACLDALGRRDEARAAYRRYLDVLPSGRFAERARAALGSLAAP